jgi:branched-chain amino acid transport system substrate-binding protein
LRLNRALAAGVLLPVLALAVAACGSSNKKSGSSGISGSTLTIYSSLPLQGATRGQATAVNNGEQLALDDVGGKVGKYKINFVKLDDSTAQAGAMDQGKTGQNAREAVRNKNTIFYLGEFNSGGTKVSLPILNKANIPQISPANTYIGLTTNEPGSEPGEPNVYYPGGTRTYARVVPRDKIQGAALVTVMKQDGCKTVTLWNDKSTYGAGLARNVALSAKAAGITIQDQQGTDKNAGNYRSLASKVKSDCFLWTGTTDQGGVQVFKDVAAAAPNAKLYGPDGVTEPAFTDPKQGGIPASIAPRVKLTVATLGTKDLPDAAPILARYKKQHGSGSVPPYAIYGYETMALALDVLKRAGAGANDRETVRKTLFATKNRSSVLGTYSIDANGDTTLTDYGLYVIKGGQPTYEKKIVAAG